MEPLICRTCLKTDLKSNYTNIYNNCERSGKLLKDMLEIFMPEMDLDISSRETVICLQCCESLNNAYTFKNVCLKTEERIYNYLHLHNIRLGEKINLNEILHQQMFDFDYITTPKSDHKDFKSPVVEISDSDQSNTILSEAESEKKVELTARKRPRRTTKKTKKGYEQNSLKRSYTCDKCEYKAYRLDLLETHKLKHKKNLLNVREYKCEFCMYSTLRKRALDRHLFTHKGNSEHLCEICSKTFAENYQLKLHRFTHTGKELPHKCEDCGKTYLTKSYLKQHMETKHLAKKQNCSDCKKVKCDHSFSRYYKCNMCDSSFSDKRGLDAHKFTHTGGEFPFKCLHCDFGTAWKGNLKKHLKKKH